jgi:hypothetical protein
MRVRAKETADTDRGGSMKTQRSTKYVRYDRDNGTWSVWQDGKGRIASWFTTYDAAKAEAAR